MGSQALFNTTIGQYNTAVGTAAYSFNTNGDFNTAVGFQAGFDIGTLNNTACLGYQAGGVNDITNHIEIGNTSVNWIGGEVAWSTYSDERIKNNIREDVPGLAFINLLRPVTYHLDIDRQNEMVYADPKRHALDWEGKHDIEKIKMTGFIAQEVEQAAHDIQYDFSGVQPPGDLKGIYAIRYSDFVMPLVKAVQELDAENIELKKHLSAQQQLIEQLIADVAALKEQRK